jgi:hypothetical protein
MHMTVRAAATAIFPVKLGLRLESKSIPETMTGQIKICARLNYGCKLERRGDSTVTQHYLFLDHS